jgi:hypothetical protein
MEKQGHMEAWTHGHGDMDMEKWTMETWNQNIVEFGSFTKKKSIGKWKTEAQAIVLNLFTVCSWCK